MNLVMMVLTVTICGVAVGFMQNWVVVTFKSRSAMLKECNEIELNIINNYTLENDKTYLNYYGQGSRQKVLGREGNLLVLNFKNQDQMLANSLKKKEV